MNCEFICCNKYVKFKFKRYLKCGKLSYYKADVPITCTLHIESKLKKYVHIVFLLSKIG